MIWNCKHCGPLLPMQVTSTEECTVCQHPITYRDKGAMRAKSIQAIAERHRQRRVDAMNSRIASQC